ncbi:hypothetical protein CcCBS67573_g06998 [Chytriomyces confervae]|uniref:G-protein coupled receptors family 1 profile domain-containing protein n=1 Tax=Chytriomyces confervae TaxID=246404 RepID=A0A507EY71_9FUNG|nr:hypothetical protein CcCBS67573_g06998 [Chytriomyces confervae]
MNASDWTYSTITTVIAFIGILLNLILIVPNVWRARSLTPSSLLIVCLCCSDTLLLSNCLSLAATHLRRGDLEYNPIICQIHGFLITFCSLLSLGLCTGLTLFRYIIIVRKTPVLLQCAHAYLAGSAAFCALIAGLPFICNAGERIYIMAQTHMNCTVAWSNTDTTSRVISWICMSIIIIPVSCMGFAYTQIYSEVSKVFGAFRKSFAVAGDNLSGDQQRGSKTTNPDSNHQGGYHPSKISTNPENFRKPSFDEKAQRPPKMLNKRKRTEEEAKQMALLMQSIAIVGLFLIGWTPYLSMGLYEIVTGTKVHPDFEFAAEMFASMNNSLNPVVAMVFDDKIRGNVVQFFSCAEE